jgi:GntR family transcriptional regulator, transcriptional repressor for pyruvate dehydrogenase complex
MPVTQLPKKSAAAKSVLAVASAQFLEDPRSKFRMVHTRRTFEEVTAQVRQMLFDGSLQPGDRLPPERELSELLGVGRPALREALRALEVSGLIELRKGKTGGAFMTQGDPRVVSGGMSDLLRLGSASVEQLFEAREWILSSLVRPACRRIRPEEIGAMRRNVAEAEQLHKAGRYRERIERNFEFHTLIAQATRNPFAIISIAGLTDALRSLIDAVGSDLSSSFFPNRRELIKALEERDEDAAAKVVARIVKATEQTYKRLAEEKTAQVKGGTSTLKPLASRKSVRIGTVPTTTSTSRR